MDPNSEMSGILFQALARARHRAVLAALAPMGLTHLEQAMILLSLQEAGPEGAKQQALLGMLELPSSSAAACLRGLERGGYVEKMPHPADARQRLVSLTARGSAAAGACLRAIRTVDRRMFGGLAREELDLLAALQRQMLAGLQNEDGPRCPGCG